MRIRGTVGSQRVRVIGSDSIEVDVDWGFLDIVYRDAFVDMKPDFVRLPDHVFFGFGVGLRIPISDSGIS